MLMRLRQSPKQTILLASLLLTLIIFLASNVYSAQVAVEWDPSSSPGVDGYITDPTDEDSDAEWEVGEVSIRIGIRIMAWDNEVWVSYLNKELEKLFK